MTFRSLESRLLAGLGIGLITLVGCVWWFGHLALHRLGESLVLARLQRDAEALVGALHRNEDGSLFVREHSLTAVYNQPYSGYYFVFMTMDGEQIQSRSLWDQELRVKPVSLGEQSSVYAAGPSGQTLLVWLGGFRKSGMDFSLAVAENMDPIVAKLKDLEWLLAGITVSGLFLLGLIQRYFIRQTFRQLQPVYADIERLESGDAETLTENVPVEVLPLVHKLNRVLELFRQRLERSRNATGNLAHALKGPLNLMGQQLHQSGACSDRTLVSDLGEQIERIRRLMERELKRARFAGAGNPGQRFDPREELPVLGRLLSRTYANKNLNIETRITIQQPFTTDREDMLELLGNLLDNACKWAESRVVCTVDQQHDRAEFRVDDDGPGCSEEEFAAIALRGVRLDESTSGHGLGLAIVKDVVDLYGGHVEYGRSVMLGGFRAMVTLPLHSNFTD